MLRSTTKFRRRLLLALGAALLLGVAIACAAMIYHVMLGHRSLPSPQIEISAEQMERHLRSAGIKLAPGRSIRKDLPAYVSHGEGATAYLGAVHGSDETIPMHVLIVVDSAQATLLHEYGWVDTLGDASYFWRSPACDAPLILWSRHARGPSEPRRVLDRAVGTQTVPDNDMLTWACVVQVAAHDTVPIAIGMPHRAFRSCTWDREGVYWYRVDMRIDGEWKSAAIGVCFMTLEVHVEDPDGYLSDLMELRGPWLEHMVQTPR